MTPNMHWAEQLWPSTNIPTLVLEAPKLQEDDKSCDHGFIATLLQGASTANELQMIAKLLHFNFRGADFLSVHRFMDGQYQKHGEQFDTLAEFVAQMDVYLPLTPDQLREHRICLPDAQDYEAISLVAHYQHCLNAFNELVIGLQSLAVQHEAIEVVDYCGKVVGENRQAAWLLRAHFQTAARSGLDTLDPGAMAMGDGLSS